MVTMQDVENGTRWTHPSVLPLLADGLDPISEITARARRLVLEATSEGWSGPPFDPAALAGHLGIAVRAVADIEEARVLPAANRGYVIEYNPNRPWARVRYSLAHEIAHTLFKDCREQVRHRGKSGGVDGDEWQLEMLCNVAAAEILMPFGTLPDLDSVPLTIERVAELRKTYEVSTEAILLRAIRLSRQPVGAFAASRIESGAHSGRYRLDYVTPSKSWKPKLRPGMLLPVDTILSGCTAIGFSAKGLENWCHANERVHVEAVGVSPYRSRLYPRVVGLIRSSRGKSLQVAPGVTFVTGDATAPRGRGHRVLAHIVNDKTPNWGAGFASVVKRKWPVAQEDFKAWARMDKENLKLGRVHCARLDTDISICHMVSQKGYGPSSKPRVRYDALADCLESVAEYALAHEASVHMPLIGTGQAGGSWTIIEELVHEALVRNGVPVTVYTLPNAVIKRSEEQSDLFASMR